ncbi:MAG TPA: D-arabinono-1,4-lactone oxidase [Candidatus Babeliaceae bacterium]|nr:D-arabinono-1,4-lactone oxidase [Candidatus Babeliaceae bacterium]
MINIVPLKTLRKILLLSFALSTQILSEPWTNWGHNQQCSPCRIWNPESLGQVQEIIKQASQLKIPIRFVGSAHSWSDLVCTDGYLITTDQFNKILNIDTDKLQVTVQGGIKLKDLFEKLAQEGFALSNQGFIKEQSIAGAISTATHGTGKHGTLSDLVIGVQLVDASGKIHTIDNNNNPEWLPAARVHLGALGFIYSVTLQCEPLFMLNHIREIKRYQEVIPYYRQLYHDHDYFMVMLHPTKDVALTFTWDRTHKPLTKNFLVHLPEDIVMSYTINYLGIRSLCQFPTIGSVCLENTLYALQKKEHREYSYLSLSPLNSPVSVNCYIEEEFAIPFDYFEQALSSIKELYQQYESYGIMLAGLITCRFGPGLTLAYLDPAYGRKTAYITVNILNFFDQYEQFFQDLEKTISPFHGRPHWGKFHHLSYADIYRLYGDNAQSFNNIRLTLDPNGVFANNFIKRCFEANPAHQ